MNNINFRADFHFVEFCVDGQNNLSHFICAIKSVDKLSQFHDMLQTFGQIENVSFKHEKWIQRTSFKPQYKICAILQCDERENKEALGLCVRVCVSFFCDAQIRSTASDNTS